MSTLAYDRPPIAATNLTIDVLDARLRRDLDERYAFCRMLNATDRVLGALEQLNLDGVRKVGGDLYVAIRRQLRELPASCVAVLADSHDVQEVLDSVFEVQERLFLWRDPGRNLAGVVDAEAPPDPLPATLSQEERFRQRVLHILRESPIGAAWSDLVSGKVGTESRERYRVLLDRMEAEGLVYWATSAQGGRRYFLAGEG